MESAGLNKTELYAVFVFSTNEYVSTTIVDRDFIVYRLQDLAYHTIRKTLADLNIPKAFSAFPNRAIQLHIYCNMMDKSCKMLEYNFNTNENYVSELENILTTLEPVENIQKIHLYENARIKEIVLPISDDLTSKLTI